MGMKSKAEGNNSIIYTGSDLDSVKTATSNSKLAQISTSNLSDDSSPLVFDKEARPSKMVILLTICSSISGYMFGYDTGYISSALVNIGTDLSNKRLTSGEKEFITSATSLGALLGAILGGLFANIIGRRKVLMGSNIIFVVGTIIQLVAHTVWTMVAGRFVLGWGVGIASMISPLMLSELAPSKYRGRLIVTNGMFITGGQLIAYLINWGLTGVKHGWRVSVGLCMVPSVLQFFLFCFLPDTPRYYVMSGDYEKARTVIRKMHNSPSDAFISSTIKDMIASDSTVEGATPFRRIWNSIKLLHTVPANFRALILACGLQGIQQFTGFNSLMYFSATIFETAGFENPNAVSIIVSATNCVFTAVALCVVDTIGRRKVLLLGTASMCIAMIVSAIAFHYFGVKFTSTTLVVQATGISGWGIVIILSMVWFVASYALGIGTAAWTGVELFSDVNVRAVGAMYATVTNWAGSLVIASTFLTMLQNITPPGTFALFATLCFISVIFIYFLFPEVTGLELEETTQILSEGFCVKKSCQLSKQRKKQSKFARQSSSDFA